MKTAANLIYNRVFLEHETGAHHPENAERLRHFRDLPDTRVPAGERYLRLVHAPAYVERVRQACRLGLPLESNTPTSPRSFQAACRAVGAAVLAAERAAQGRAGNGTAPFALVRPPGHHAGRDFGGGYCLFSNLAVAALHLRNQGLRVFVLDFDLHHGNGTESVLHGEPNVMFCSFHQAGIYPWLGLESFDNCLNVGLPYRAGDDLFLAKVDSVLVPALEQFRPDIVAVSAGFDGYYKDTDILWDSPTSPNGLSLTERSYLRVKELLQPFRHFFVLEGGYNAESIRDGVAVFTGYRAPDPDDDTGRAEMERPG